MSKGENSQMINAKSRLGQNISSVDSTTSTNLTKNIFIWVILPGSVAPILILLLYCLWFRVSCCIKEMPKYSGLTVLEIYFSLMQSVVRDPGLGRMPLSSSICGFHLWVQSLCHFHPVGRGGVRG